tara:strand:- start:551 stop:1060 length:510 start_codon:yes stop_codon:yes gene_type:complete
MTTSFFKANHYNMQHMYNIYDTNEEIHKLKINENSILDFLLKRKQYFSNFLSLIFKSSYEKFLNDIEYTNITLFLPINEGFKNFNINNINKSRAIELVSSCILNDRIISEIFQTTKAAYYFSRNRSNKILLQIDDKITINKNIIVLEKNINLENGILYIINKPIMPYLI